MTDTDYGKLPRSLGCLQHRFGTALLGALLATLGTLAIQSARAGETPRPCAMNFGMTELEWDVVDAHSPFMSFGALSG